MMPLLATFALHIKNCQSAWTHIRVSVVSLVFVVSQVSVVSVVSGVPGVCGVSGVCGTSSVYGVLGVKSCHNGTHHGITITRKFKRLYQ